MPLLAGLVFSAAALSSCVSQRQGTTDVEPRHGVYAGAGVLVSRVDPDTSKASATSVKDSMSSGGSVSLGVDLNDRLSVEGHVASLGEATLEPEGSIGYTVGGISALVYGPNGDTARSRHEGVSVFGRLGLGGMDNDAGKVPFRRINDVHLLAGVGVEFGLDGNLGLRAELVSHDTDARYLQLGFIYRFAEPYDTGMAAAIDGPAESLSPVSPEPAESEPVPIDVDPCQDAADGIPVTYDGCELFDGVVEGIHFEPGSATLTQQSRSALDGVVRSLVANPDVRIFIKAHTDNRGSAAGNLQLSKRRAIAVARYLVEAGISGSRLRPQAFGESRPMISNATARGRALNRRVEFSIVP
ncbi:MAG: OmpA family protein [Granulosicoccus sp.]|nr:OmpA family protein [Granulosicoccus sp.]